MRILIVSEVFYPEDFIINDLALALVEKGHSVEVLTQYPSYPKSYVYDGYENKGYYDEMWNGITIHRYPFIEGYKDSKAKKILNYLSFVSWGKSRLDDIDSKFDFVFVSQTGPLSVALPAIYLKKKMGTSLAIWTCDIWPDAVYSYGVPKFFATSFCLDYFIRKVYCACDKIFVSSKRFAESISKYTDKEIIYLPNWFRPTETKTSRIRLDRRNFNFTFAGNVSLYQNLKNVIKGFSVSGLSDVTLNIIGDGSFRTSLEEYVLEEKINGVVFHGRIPYSEVEDVLNQSDALVLPLISNEGIQKTEPYKIQSYLHSGKPIFAICSGSVKDIVSENKLGICSNPDDVNDIARGFKEMVTFAVLNSENVKSSANNLMNGRFNKNRIISDLLNNLN